MGDYKPGDLPYPEHENRKNFFNFHYKGVFIVLLPLLYAPILLGREVIVYRYLYMTALLYSYLILNVMPVGIIAFMYIIFLPPMGIATSKGLCMSHYTDLLFLTYGSLWTGILMDGSKLSDRFSLGFLKIFGSNIRLIQVVLMCITAFLSFFANSTFVTAIMMKVAQAIMVHLNAAGVVDKDSSEPPYEIGAKPYPSWPAIGIYLTICFSATVGSMPSPFQDPNGVVIRSFKAYMAKGSQPTGISFMMLYAVPLLVGLIVIAAWIQIVFLGLFGGRIKQALADGAASKGELSQAIQDKQEELGSWTLHAIVGLILIIITFILLVLRHPILFPGWADVIKNVSCGSSVTLIALAVILFALPANVMFCRYYMCKEPAKVGAAPSLLGWKGVNTNTPWGHIFCLGAAFAATFGGVHSKFYVLLRQMFVRNNVGQSSGLLYGSLLGLILTILSPATALAHTVLPELFAAGYATNQGPGIFAVPFLTAIHNQFLLPCSTPPNTIVAGWGNIRPYQFIIGGIVPTIVMFVVLMVSGKVFGGAAFPDFLNKDSQIGNITFTTVKPG